MHSLRIHNPRVLKTFQMKNVLVNGASVSGLVCSSLMHRMFPQANILLSDEQSLEHLLGLNNDNVPTKNSIPGCVLYENSFGILRQIYGDEVCEDLRNIGNAVEKQEIRDASGKILYQSFEKGIALGKKEFLLWLYRNGNIQKGENIRFLPNFELTGLVYRQDEDYDDSANDTIYVGRKYGAAQFRNEEIISNFDCIVGSDGTLSTSRVESTEENASSYLIPTMWRVWRGRLTDSGTFPLENIVQYWGTEAFLEICRINDREITWRFEMKALNEISSFDEVLARVKSHFDHQELIQIIEATDPKKVYQDMLYQVRNNRLSFNDVYVSVGHARYVPDPILQQEVGFEIEDAAELMLEYLLSGEYTEDVPTRFYETRIIRDSFYQSRGDFLRNLLDLGKFRNKLMQTSLGTRALNNTLHSMKSYNKKFNSLSEIPGM